MLGRGRVGNEVCSVDDRSLGPPPWPVPRPSRREEFAAAATGAKTGETTAKTGARSGVRSVDNAESGPTTPRLR